MPRATTTPPPCWSATSGNMTTYFSRFAPELATTQYGKEIWSLYERGALHPESAHRPLRAQHEPVDVPGVMREIDDVRAEHEARQRYKALIRE